MFTRTRDEAPVAEPDGEWVDVALPDGTMRRDWVPTDQPAPPGGYPGFWHVVHEPDGESRWEWHPLLAPRRDVDPDAPTAYVHTEEYVEEWVRPQPGPWPRPPQLGYALLCFPAAAAVVSGVMLFDQLVKR